MTEASLRTTCPYCGVGCGVLVSAGTDGELVISGDPLHPANRGRLCSKGMALGQTLSLDGRLLRPEIDGRAANWSTAFDTIARTFQKTIADHGPDSVALYVSGQFLTEDYYVANKFMKGFVGSANIDTNSRLCMASSVAGHKRAFGADVVPGCYNDLELADLVVLVGSNLAWCHPILFQRLSAARRERGTKVVLIDPRRTATAEIADLHLKIKPDGDVALFAGLLRALADRCAIDQDYVEAHTSGLSEALDMARALSVDDVATQAGLAAADVEAFYKLYCETPRTVSVFSQGVNQSASGTDKVNAIINCHLATGRIGKPGMGPLSVTGQPNAMGGREVGGLANMLAAHMDLDNAEHRHIVQSFWRSPTMATKPGLKAVELFDAVKAGRVKALWIMATNPVVSMPDADAVRAALEACPFVVVSDVEARTDTTVMADVLLPSLAWGEKDGTVTNSERMISRQRSFLGEPGEALSDWQQIAEVAKRMGFAQGFAWTTPAEIFAEYAALTGFENNGRRALDIGAFGALSRATYDALEPFQWPKSHAGAAIEPRFFADGGFFTADKRARFVATPAASEDVEDDTRLPFVLNTGRIRDHWHTMTRTAKSERLAGHIAEPFVEIHPLDADSLGLEPAGLALINNGRGSALLRVSITDKARAGSVFVPMHWSGETAASARVDALVAPDCDPVSGQPALKQSRVAIAPFSATWFGFAVGSVRPQVKAFDYWALARTGSGWRAEIADRSDCVAGDDLMAQLWPRSNGRCDVLSYDDSAHGEWRGVVFEGEQLVAALFLARTPVVCARAFLSDQIGRHFTDAQSRYRLLAGRPGADVQDKGAIVCSCFEIGRTAIVEAITAGGAATVEAVGAATRAGTNCGSCRSEISGLIHACRLEPVGSTR